MRYRNRLRAGPHWPSNECLGGAALGELRDGQQQNSPQNSQDCYANLTIRTRRQRASNGAARIGSLCLDTKNDTREKCMKAGVAATKRGGTVSYVLARQISCKRVPLFSWSRVVKKCP